YDEESGEQRCRDELEKDLLELGDHHDLYRPVEHHLLYLVAHAVETLPGSECEEACLLEKELYVYRELRYHRALDVAEIEVEAEVLGLVEDFAQVPYPKTDMTGFHSVVDRVRALAYEVFCSACAYAVAGLVLTGAEVARIRNRHPDAHRGPGAARHAPYGLAGVRDPQRALYHAVYEAHARDSH